MPILLGRIWPKRSTKKGNIIELKRTPQPLRALIKKYEVKIPFPAMLRVMPRVVVVKSLSGSFQNLRQILADRFLEPILSISILSAETKEISLKAKKASKRLKNSREKRASSIFFSNSLNPEDLSASDLFDSKFPVFIKGPFAFFGNAFKKGKYKAIYSLQIFKFFIQSKV